MTADLSATARPGDPANDEPRFVQEIRRLLAAGDRDGLLGYVTAASQEDLAEATGWFTKRGRALQARNLDWRLWDPGLVTFEEMLDGQLARSVVTLALSSPAVAAKVLPWRNLGNRNKDVAVLLDVLVSKGEIWCRRFVAASIERNAKAGEGPAIAVVRHCLPLILHFGLITADFVDYPRLWAVYYRELLAGKLHEDGKEEIGVNHNDPGWSGVEFRISADGRAEAFPQMQQSLMKLWDQDATAPGTLLRCFEIANALSPLTRRGTGKEWTVGAAVRGYVQRGTYSRTAVLDRVFTALARTDGIPTQRVLADVLQVLEPCPDELAGAIPLLLTTVATAPGFLSATALRLLLTVPLDSGDVQELSAAVFGRTEKRPQDLLVRHFKSAQAVGRYDDDVLAACWEAAAASTDLSIRTMAEAMLAAPALASVAGGIDASADPPLAPAPSLWGTGAGEQEQSPRYVPLDVDPTRWFSKWDNWWAEPIAEEQYLDRFLRAVYHQPQSRRDLYRERYPLGKRAEATYFPEGLAATTWGWWGDPDPETVVSMWASGDHGLVEHSRLVELLRASAQPGPFDRGDPFYAATPLAMVRILRLSELTVQAGTVAYSLATPSYRNFKLDLDRLVAVLRVYEEYGWRYGEADLLQALLRLGPVGAERVADIPDLSVAPLDGSADAQRSAGNLLRLWAGGGGFTAPAVDTPLVLPVGLELFPTLPVGLVEPSVWNGGSHGYAHSWLSSSAGPVVPFWPDLGAIWFRRRVVSTDLVTNRNDCIDIGTAGELGVLAYEWLLDSIATADTHRAERTLQLVIGLAAGRRLSAQKIADAARNRVQAGVPLGRLARKLALIAYEGHLDCVWPTLIALAVLCAGQQKVPAGTPELLATCSELWDVIPAEHRGPETVPAELATAVRALAAKSSTKTGLEAKRFASRIGF